MASHLETAASSSSAYEDPTVCTQCRADVLLLRQALDAECRAGVLLLRQALDAERLAFEALKSRVAHQLSTKRVKLNVGGTRYETTVATLTRYGNSYFGVLLSGRFAG